MFPSYKPVGEGADPQLIQSHFLTVRLSREQA